MLRHFFADYAAMLMPRFRFVFCDYAMPLFITPAAMLPLTLLRYAFSLPITSYAAAFFSLMPLRHDIDATLPPFAFDTPLYIA